MPGSAVRLPADPASVAAARALVRDELTGAGRPDLVEDAALAVTELAANAVLHAHTEITVTVAVTDAGVRVVVEDGSAVLPVPLPVGPSALSGRGLALVAAVTDRWGADPAVTGGKAVWFELTTAKSAPETASAEQLLEAWADLEALDADRPVMTRFDGDEHVSASAGAGLSAAPVDAAPLVTITLNDVDAALLLSTRQHSDDLIREMILLLLNSEARVTGHVSATAVVRLARRLTAAAEEFEAARHQLTAGAAAAVVRRQPTTSVRLLLDPADAAAAQRYGDALDEADELAATGLLLVDPCTPAQRTLRHWYLAEIANGLKRPQPRRLRAT